MSAFVWLVNGNDIHNASVSTVFEASEQWNIDMEYHWTYPNIPVRLRYLALRFHFHIKHKSIWICSLTLFLFILGVL